MSDSFVAALPQPAETPNILALSRFIRETVTPANATTVLTFGHTIIAGIEQLFKAGVLLSPSAYSLKGNKVTLSVGANGTDEYQLRYYFTDN